MEVLEQLEDQEEKHYINAVHKSSKGWITKAEIQPKFKQWHYKVQELLQQSFGSENTYISMNTFYSTYRRTEYIKELKALYIDLDIHKLGVSKEKALMNLDDNYINTKVPRPNMVIDSGRGLYLIWLINSVPSQALPLWKAVEDFLYNELKELGADRQALDATRILRVPGSINSKSNTVVKIIEEYNYIYDLREIQEGYLPELKPKEKKKGRPKKTVFIYRERSLYHARIQDIIKICELREYDLRGHRELILFLYRYYLCYFTEDVQKALEDTLELNRMFIYPLRGKEVISATRSAEKVYQDKNKDYKYKNDTLIELLDISEEEQKHMKTIIGNKEYKRRHNTREKKRYQDKLKESGKLSKQDELNQLREKIKTLKNQGFKNKQIAQELDLNIKTLERHITYIRKKGLLG